MKRSTFKKMMEHAANYGMGKEEFLAAFGKKANSNPLAGKSIHLIIIDELNPKPPHRAQNHELIPKPLTGSRPIPIIFVDIQEVEPKFKFKPETWDRETQAMGQFTTVAVEWNMWAGKWTRKLELRVDNYINGEKNSFNSKHIKYL